MLHNSNRYKRVLLHKEHLSGSIKYFKIPYKFIKNCIVKTGGFALKTALAY